MSESPKLFLGLLLLEGWMGPFLCMEDVILGTTEM